MLTRFAFINVVTIGLVLAVFPATGNFCCGQEVVVSDAASGVMETQVLTPIEQRMRKTVSVDFKETPIDDVLRILSQQAGVDIVKSPKVVGDVTATLTNVPLSEALQNILAVHGFTYVASENMIRVVPAEEVAIDQTKLTSKVYRIMYADVKDVTTALKEFISKNGEISYSQGTRNIIITDSEDKIRAIDTFIKEIDRITPQVLVEARIYDISSDDRLDLGVKWQAGRIGANVVDEDSGGGALEPVATNTPYKNGDIGGIGNTISNSSTSKTDPHVTGLFDAGTNMTEDGDGLLRFGFLNKYVNVDALLKAEQKVISAKLLANPRVLVLDNEEAYIKIVEEIPYQQLSQTTGGGNIGTTEFKEVGVDLKVVPHITDDGYIRLNLTPKFSTQVDSFGLAVPGTSQLSQVPVINTRETNTVALIKDGETVVLGGLRKKATNTELNKIPVLGDIPLVGIIFRFKGEKDVNSELVVFITPHVVVRPTLTSDENRILQQTYLPPVEVNKPLIMDKLKKS